LTHKLGALLRGPNGTSHLRRPPPTCLSFVSSLRAIWTFHFITNYLVFSCAKHGKKPDKGSGNKHEKSNRFGNECKKKATRNWLNNFGHGMQPCGTRQDTAVGKPSRRKSECVCMGAPSMLEAPLWIIALVETGSFLMNLSYTKISLNFICAKVPSVPRSKHTPSRL